MAWVVRYRFWISKPLNSDKKTLSFELDGHPATLHAVEPGAFEDGPALSQSNWLVLAVRGFADEDDAQRFSIALVSAVSLAGIEQSIGIDGGENSASPQFSQDITDSIERGGTSRIMPNVHGVSVYEERGGEIFITMSATATVFADPEKFGQSIGRSLPLGASMSDEARTALALTALSKAAREPLTQAVLAISAVELVSKGSPWTRDQLALLEELRLTAQASTKVSGEAREEVAKAIKDGVFKSIRQSVRKKIGAIGLSDLWGKFDDIYKLRSRIFHGSPHTRADRVKLAAEAGEVCDKIVLAAARTSNPHSQRRG